MKKTKKTDREDKVKVKLVRNKKLERVFNKNICKNYTDYIDEDDSSQIEERIYYNKY